MTWFLQIISLSETLAWNLASAAWSWGNGECCWSGCPGALDWDLRWEEAVTCWPHRLGVKLRPDWTAERNREEDPVVAGCQDSCCSYWCFRRFSPIMFLYAYACTYIYMISPVMIISLEICSTKHIISHILKLNLNQ